jgi:hypothetical protein
MFTSYIIRGTKLIHNPATYDNIGGTGTQMFCGEKERNLDENVYT